MKNDHISPLNWRRHGSIEIATDRSLIFKIDRTEGHIRLILSDQLEEYLTGNCETVTEAKRKAREKRLELLVHDRSEVYSLR
ncbi:hypothetical protein U0035_01320 [Niabella yanshanensis]|uniref:DUF1508 domain-containing protein n=1 Tax=Niabella yanshanensis TaxID=577386 RepID=A0ABZ0W6B4_9BACT|nr:hypothetical protein [Niabella yanshanensis]WQD38782.1 hypothetical protein U0035_01320 [Niabella yanshanensis]